MKSVLVYAVVAATVSLMTATAWAGRNDDDARPDDLKRMLGPDFAGAQLVGYSDGNLVHVDLATGKQTVLMELPSGADEPTWVSRPYFSSDGRTVALSVDGAAYLIHVATGEKNRILPDREAHEPMFWTDPDSGERCILFKDIEGNILWPEDRGEGKTYRWRPVSDKVEVVAEFPFDSGLSRDGTFIFDTHGHAIARDLDTGRTWVLNAADIACNGSMSPDNSHRVMHLVWPHEHFAIRNKFDRELWRIYKFSGAEEWDHPRWSNHPDFCTAISKYATDHYVTFIDIRSRQKLILRSLGGDWEWPQLWLPTGPHISRTSRTPLAGLNLKRLYAYNEIVATAEHFGPMISQLKKMTDEPEAAKIVAALEGYGRAALTEAERAAQPDQYEAILNELTWRFAGHDIGRRASRMLSDMETHPDREAVRETKQLIALASMLTPVAEAEPDYCDPIFYAKNRKLLDSMAELYSSVLTNWPESEAATRAEELAQCYNFPPVGDDDFDQDDLLEVHATIVAVSRVPTLREVAPYEDVITYVRYRVDRVTKGDYEPKEIVACFWGMRAGKHTDAAAYKIGQRHALTLDTMAAHRELRDVPVADAADDPTLDAFWTHDVAPLP